MSMDAGASGAFGILLSEYLDGRPEMDDLKDQLTALTADAEDDCEDPDYDSEKIAMIAGLFIARFKELGFDVPKEASLYWTGWDDDRPARCQVGPDEWILGFGIFTKPWNYPSEWPAWFKNHADFYNWVWMT